MKKGPPPSGWALCDAHGNECLVLDLYPHSLLPHGDGDLVQEGQHQEADRPDADGDHGLGHRRPVELMYSAAELREFFDVSGRILSSECRLDPVPEVQGTHGHTAFTKRCH